MVFINSVVHLKCTVLSSGIQAQILVLLDIFLALDNSEKKMKNCQFLIKLAIVRNISVSCMLLDNGRNSQAWTVQLFWIESIWKVYHWLQRQQVVTLVNLFGTGWKETSIGFKKSAPTRTIEASRKLPAGAGKFPPVVCENSRQSLPAEIFACILR